MRQNKFQKCHLPIVYITGKPFSFKFNNTHLFYVIRAIIKRQSSDDSTKIQVTQLLNELMLVP